MFYSFFPMLWYSMYHFPILKLHVVFKKKLVFYTFPGFEFPSAPKSCPARFKFLLEKLYR